MRQWVHHTGRLLRISWASLAIQVSVTDYGTGGPELALAWLVVGSLLLLLVHRRRSRVARALVIVPALAGAIGYGLTAFNDPSHLFVAVTFLGQAVPLLMPGVRRYVQPVGAAAKPAFRLSRTTSAKP